MVVEVMDTVGVELEVVEMGKLRVVARHLQLYGPCDPRSKSQRRFVVVVGLAIPC